MLYNNETVNELIIVTQQLLPSLMVIVFQLFCSLCIFIFFKCVFLARYSTDHLLSSPPSKKKKKDQITLSTMKVGIIFILVYSCLISLTNFVVEIERDKKKKKKKKKKKRCQFSWHLMTIFVIEMDETNIFKKKKKMNNNECRYILFSFIALDFSQGLRWPYM